MKIDIFATVVANVAAAILLGIGGNALAQAAPKGSAEAAATKISMCIGCHGLVGYQTAFPVVYHVPMISGQSQDYLTKALQAYRAGERSHPSMTAVAKSLSDQDIAVLAAYYGKGR